MILYNNATHWKNLDLSAASAAGMVNKEYKGTLERELSPLFIPIVVPTQFCACANRFVYILTTQLNSH